MYSNFLSGERLGFGQQVSTGVYGEAVAEVLTAHGMTVSVVNLRRSRHSGHPGWCAPRPTRSMPD